MALMHDAHFVVAELVARCTLRGAAGPSPGSVVVLDAMDLARLLDVEMRLKARIAKDPPPAGLDLFRPSAEALRRVGLVALSEDAALGAGLTGTAG